MWHTWKLRGPQGLVYLNDCGDWWIGPLGFHFYGWRSRFDWCSNWKEPVC